MQGGLSHSPDSRTLEARDESSDHDSHVSNRGPPESEVQIAQGPSHHNPKSATLSKTSTSTAMPLARSNTLSWQQRPTSQGSTSSVRSRPLSAVATHKNTTISPRASPDPTSTSERVISRTQVVQSLGSKDPAWFRQTKARAVGSAGNRRNQGKEVSNSAAESGSVRLPGLSREASREPEKELSPAPESLRSSSPSREGSIRGTSGSRQPYLSSAAGSSASGIRSPLPSLSSQRFEPPFPETEVVSDADAPTISRTLAMSPSQGRISPERSDRPASPTKGLGGFVQSAMLKRSDSVNKRWSAQPGAGLSRGNSIASNRSGYDGSKTGEIKSGNLSSDSSPTTKSRPGSSHSNVTLTHQQAKSEGRGGSVVLDGNRSDLPSNSRFIKPALPHQKSSTAVSEARMNHRDVGSLEKSPPLSPNKRWSPTKASWLENAINKPESPRTKAPAPQQPSWMAEINRAKQQRGSVDLGKSDAHREVASAAIVESLPLGRARKSPSIEGLPVGFDVDLIKKTKTELPGAEASTGSRSKEASVEANSRISPPPLLRSSKKPIIVEDLVEIGENTQEHNDPTIASPVKSKATPTDIRKGTFSPLKPKPETPPKKDFRSNLKTRQVSTGKENNDDAEFKNVFGKLKRTQTQNYVAPDELKDNILRGKAGLAMTGGPKKTERRDDFKESLLKQKEAMKAGTSLGISRKISGNSMATEDPPTPEAIVKKKGLMGSDSVVSNISTEGEKTPTKPEAIAKLERLREKPKPAPPVAKPGVPTNTPKEQVVQSKTASNFTGSLADLISKGPSPVVPGSKPSVAMNPSSFSNPGSSAKNNTEEGTAAGPQLTHMTKARARGPKRRLPKNVMEDVSPSSPTFTAMPEPPEQSPGTISPKSQREAKPSLASTITGKLDTRPLTSISNNGNRKASQSNTPRKPSTSIVSSDKMKAIPSSLPEGMSQVVPKASPVIKPKPGRVSNDDTTRKSLASSSAPQPVIFTPATPLKNHQPQINPTKFTLAHDHERIETVGDEMSAPSVRNVAATWEKSPTSSSSHPTRTKSPIKLPTRKDEETALQEAGLVREEIEVPVGLGIQTTRKEPEVVLPLERNLPISPAQSPRSPPLPAKKPTLVANRVVSTPPLPKLKPGHLNSPIHQPSEATRLFVEYFNEVPSSSGRVNIDTQSVLASRSSSAGSNKIKTLRKQIWEVTGDGKSVAVPSYQEHILFEESMYLCTHVFGNAAGTRTTEVYLWCGDGVPSSAAEDAQLFAKKVAKDSNGKLLLLQQGKETANFFEALGGIVITRRGSSSRADRPSSAGAIYMLCGRRHVGQIAFDEVDFHPRSLCSGFPYIVSARFGKLYLWKGSGSSADELGCARLIGMDLGLTGEIEEIDEGQEPDAFWESFSGGKRTDGINASGNGKAEHWRLKATCEKYTTRLFSVDLEAPRSKFGSGFSWARRGSAPSSEEGAVPTAQIREINSFKCLDLVDDGVFVLDTFFEIYV